MVIDKYNPRYKKKHMRAMTVDLINQESDTMSFPVFKGLNTVSESLPVNAC